MSVKTNHESRWYSEFLARYILGVATGEGSISERCEYSLNEYWYRDDDLSEMNAAAYRELVAAFEIIGSSVPDVTTSGYNEDVSRGFRKLNEIECVSFLMRLQRAREILVADLVGEEA
ncbi:hypothetical protein [Stappia indica]|uniref:hypothetical protein n=1 Tax=Stappia indica TaxID=538381 RepID=UPI0011428A35|nr:hypothetical protein [Stappia indica]